MHICPVSADGQGAVRMTSKKIFRNDAGVAFTLHFFAGNLCRESTPQTECTEKVQAWKLFFAKTLFSRNFRSAIVNSEQKGCVACNGGGQ